MAPTTPLARYLAECYALQRAIAPSTEYLIGRSIRAFQAWLGRVPTLADLSDFQVSRWLRDLEVSGTLAPKTIAGRRGDLLALWRYAAEDGLVDAPARVRVVKVPAPMPIAWTPAELAAILREAQQLPGYLGNGLPRRLYFPALLQTAYETGLRRNDLLRVQLRDMDSEGTLVVLQRKTGRGHVCAVHPETRSLLLELQQRLERDQDPAADRPLHWPHTMRQLYHWLDKITTAAGARKGALQQARRTGATHAERQLPGAGSRYLGHTSDSQARRHYIDRSQAYGPVLPPRIEQG